MPHWVFCFSFFWPEAFWERIRMNDSFVLLNHISETSAVIISVSIMLFSGFLMTRLMKLLRLPNVTAYILTGILIGPFVLDLIPMQITQDMDFLSDIALAFIAFSTGQYFRFTVLRRNDPKVIVITLLEALLASALVFILCFLILHLPLEFSAVLSALASTTAPASTLMTIRQTGAHGDFVDTLLQVVALDDVVGLLAYSLAIAIATASVDGRDFGLWETIMPIFANIGVLLLGGVFGLLLKLLIRRKRTTDNRLIIALSLLFAFCGICSLLDISPLLGCMSMGMIYCNLAEDDGLFKQDNYFNPPILLLFFVHSGVQFDLDALIHPSGLLGSIPLLTIGILYFIVRIVGKYTGAYLGSLIVRKGAKVRNFLGLALTPQAGVAIGLAALGARTLGGDAGNSLQTIILASSILYELTGPALAKLSLYLSGSYTTDSDELVQVKETSESGEAKSDVDLLIERIQEIQKHIPPHSVPQEEPGFTRAAEEFYDSYYSLRHHFPGRR